MQTVFAHFTSLPERCPDKAASGQFQHMFSEVLSQFAGGETTNKQTNKQTNGINWATQTHTRMLETQEQPKRRPGPGPVLHLGPGPGHVFCGSWVSSI